MKSLILKKNKKFQLIETKRKKLNNYEYRLKILYSGICSSDIPRAFENKAYHYPLVLGHEFVGKIIECGPRTNRFCNGENVAVFPLIPCFIHKKNITKGCAYCEKSMFNLCQNYKYFGSRNDGSFSEEIIVNEWNIFKFSKKINIRLACLLEPVSVASNIVQKFKNNNIDKGKILILGAGFIGQITAVLSKKFFNSEIYVLDKNAYKLKKLKKYKINTFQNDPNGSDEYFLKKFINKFDVIIELTGNTTMLINSIKLVKKNGTIILPSNFNNGVDLDNLSLSLLSRKELNIYGVWNSKFKLNNSDWNISNNFLKNNAEIEDLITHQTKLENAAELLNKIYNRKKIDGFNYIKAIIKNN